MNKIKITKEPGRGHSTCYYNGDRNKCLPVEIIVDTERGVYKMSLFHEIGHCLTSKTKQNKLEMLRGMSYEADRYLFKRELLAWRVARFLLPKYLWDDKWFKRCIGSYSRLLSHINIEKLKCIPLSTYGEYCNLTYNESLELIQQARKVKQ
jgi:hypothetical protein